MTCPLYRVHSTPSPTAGKPTPIPGLLPPGTPAGQWGAIQIDVLGDMLSTAVRAGDPLAAWTAAARLLRHHYALITPTGQLSLAAAMQAAAEKLPAGTRGTDPTVPFVRLQGLTPLPPPMQVGLLGANGANTKKKTLFASDAGSWLCFVVENA